MKAKSIVPVKVQPYSLLTSAINGT